MIKILLECGQEIPDFLADHKPAEGEPLVFDDDSSADDDEEEGTGEGSDAWDCGGNAANRDDGGADAWGSVKSVAAADDNNWDAGKGKGGW